jgi:DNA-binding MarR family transcriptional regulator
VGTRRRSKAAQAEEAWGYLYDIFLANRDRYTDAATEHGLNPGSMNALLSLDPAEPKPMRALAQEWRCDASNVTWLVDRLEERGLVERRPSPTDRRVKTVQITPAGVATAEAVWTSLRRPPEDLLRLTVEELDQLRTVLAKLASGAGS